MNEKRLEPLKLTPVPRLLDHVGLAMYSKYPKAIGELVVNGYDADATKVEINIKMNRITIKDDGSGMDESDIREGYMLLGSDQKRRVKRTPRFERLPIGNKGIGKLAGLGIAKRIEVITAKDGREYKFTIDRDKIEKAGILEKALYEFTVSDSPDKPSGTVVILTKILPHVKIETAKLRGYLAMEIPQDYDFRIFVNNSPCIRTDIPAKRKIKVDHIIELCGHIKGEIIVAKKSFSSIPAGVLTTVRGRVVGKPSLFDINRGSHKYHHAELITGTVEVTSFDPEDEPDAIPVIQTNREGFIEDHPKYRAYHKFMRDLLIQICKEEEKKYNEKREAEKKAKVQEALKNIIDDFNAYNKEKEQEVKTPSATMAEAGIGDEKIIKKTEEALKETRAPDKEKRTNPVGIIDKRIRKQLKGLVGLGTIKLGTKRYKILTKPMGVDNIECMIDDEALVININIDHPAYDQAIQEKAVEITVFRAIATAFARKESELAGEMYERIDEMIRYQAYRMNQRRLKAKHKKEIQIFSDEEL